MVWSSLLDSHCTPWLRALVLSLHEHSSTLTIAFRIIAYYTRYCYSMYKYHCYSDTDNTWHYYSRFMNHWYMNTILHVPHYLLIHVPSIYIDTPVQWTPSFHPLVSSLHGCLVHSYIMFTHHYYIYLPVYMHWLDYFYILVIWITVHSTCIIGACIFLYSRYMIISRYWYWYSHSWTRVLLNMRCVKLSATWIQATGATSRIPHLLFLVSHYLVIYYRQSSCHVSVLHVLYLFLIYYIVKDNKENLGMGETWRLTRWISWSIVCPTAGDGVVLTTICYSSWALVSRYCFSSLSSRYMLQP